MTPVSPNRRARATAAGTLSVALLLGSGLASAQPASEAPLLDASQPAGTAPGAKAQPTRPTPPPRPAGPAREPAIRLRGLADVSFVQFQATDSFKAVYDSNTGLLFGGGVQVNHRSGLFGMVHASRFKADGQRVFVSDGEVFPLGIDSTLTLVPLEVSVGWRVLPRPPGPPRAPAPPPPAPRRDGALSQVASQPPAQARPTPRAPRGPRRWIPYVGAGLGVVQVEETADFASSGDDVSDSFTSYQLFGGVEYPVSRWVGVAVEGGWRFVPDALAGDGVAQAFKETALDHLGLTVRLTIGR